MKFTLEPESSSAVAVTLLSEPPARGGVESITGRHGKRARGCCESVEEVDVAALVLGAGFVLASAAFEPVVAGRVEYPDRSAASRGARFGQLGRM